MNAHTDQISKYLQRQSRRNYAYAKYSSKGGLAITRHRIINISVLWRCSLSTVRKYTYAHAHNVTMYV